MNLRESPPPEVRRIHLQGNSSFVNRRLKWSQDHSSKNVRFWHTLPALWTTACRAASECSIDRTKIKVSNPDPHGWLLRRRAGGQNGIPIATAQCATSTSFASESPHTPEHGAKADYTHSGGAPWWERVWFGGGAGCLADSPGPSDPLRPCVKSPPSSNCLTPVHRPWVLWRKDCLVHTN
jgi:hypothetical protein